MSIADKLTYLDTTKQLLKTEINKIKNVLDDNSTFRSYPQELFNGYLDVLNNGTDTLWSNLEKVSQIGTEAVLENVENAPMKIELSGNTSQETTEGYNLADYSDNYISKNLSNFGAFNLTLNNSFLIDVTKTYYFSADVRRISGSGITKMNVIRSTNNSGQVTNAINTPNMTSEFQRYVFSCTYTAEQTLTQVAFQIVTEQSAVIEVKNIMVSTTNTEYEPYTGNQPSPSPDYPQEVKVVTGENVVSVSGKNLCVTSNFINATIKDDGTLLNGNDSFATDYIPIKPNISYNLSFKNGLTVNFYGVAYYDSDKEYISRVIKNGQNNLTFTTVNNATYLRVFGQPKVGVTFNKEEFDTYEIQLEEGSTATPYVSYSKTDYPINLVAENIFDKDDARILRGYVYVSDKGIKTSNSDYSVIVKVKPSTKYIVTKMANNPENQARFRLGTATNYPQMGGARDNICNQVISNDTATELSITTESNDNYLVIFCYNLNSTTTLNEMLGSLVVREAEPIYKEMCKIGDYKDYFYKDSGKWYGHKEIGKVVLDGSESWSSPNKNQFNTTKNITTKTNTEISNIYCNAFKGAPAFNTDGNFYNYVINNELNNIICLHTNTHGIRIYATKYSTVQEFKDWLASNNVTLYYVLATPTEEEITNTTLIEQLEAISKAKSVKEKTYITQENDELPFVLDVEAIKKYEVA